MGGGGRLLRGWRVTVDSREIDRFPKKWSSKIFSRSMLKNLEGGAVDTLATPLSRTPIVMIIII